MTKQSNQKRITNGPQGGQKKKNTGMKSKAKPTQGTPKGVTQKAPTQSSTVRKATAPVYSSLPEGGVRIRHREYVAEVLMDALFTVTPYAINAALGGTFPWLANVAANFEKYAFRNLCFEHLTESSTANAGVVMLVPDYDPNDTAPTSKQEALTYQDSVRGSYWQDICTVLKKRELSRRPAFCCRIGTPAGSLNSGSYDLNNYDVGNLFVCTSGASTGNIGSASGELWVEYEVDLMNPASVPNLTPTNAGLLVVSGAAPSKQNPLGTGPAAQGPYQGEFFDSWTQPGNDSISFNLFPGAFLAEVYITGSISGATQCSVSSAGSVVTTAHNILNNSSTIQSTLFEIIVAAGNTTEVVTFTIAPGVTTITGMTLRLAPFFVTATAP